MIVVRVELHSAITKQVTELARMHIANVGGTHTAGDYRCTALRGRNKAAFDVAPQINRHGEIKGYPRLKLHVWHLVARALIAMNYAGKRELMQPGDMDDTAAETRA